MSEHQTFSLHTILTSAQIKPQVYKHIIREIKSPLQQQSFQLTIDDSNNSHAFQNIPKRPNIPPPPTKNYHGHFQNNHFSRTYQSFSEDLQQGQSKHRGDLNRNEVQSFVSPLQYDVNSKSPFQNNFCGGFQSILKLEERTQVLLPTKSRNGKRKPIFQKKLQQKHLKTVDQALSKLKSMNQNQLVLLLQLMRDLEKELAKLLNDKNTMQTQLPYLFQRLALETQHSPSTLQTNQAYSKILQRLKSKNSGQVIKKLFRRDVKHYKVGQALLEKLFTGLSRIQTIISQYINKQQSAQKLAEAFDFITHNFQKQPTFKAQLSKFYNSLSIEISTNGLQFIWQGCGERNISKAEFLEGINLNHFIIRQKQGFEDMLAQKGFMRNEY